MRGYKRGFILIALLGIILLALSGSSTMVQNVSATPINILYMVGAEGSGQLAYTAGSTQYTKTFSSAASVTWSKSDWLENWWAGVDAASWTVVVWAQKVTAPAKITITIGLTGKTSVSETLTITSTTPAEKTSAVLDTLAAGWADRDASTTWLCQPGQAARTLSVTIAWSSGSTTIWWGDGTYPSRMNTGTIVPENLLALVFAAPLIPMFARSLAKRGRVKKR